MNLKRFWPWNRFDAMESEILRLQRELKLLRNIHKSKKDEMETAIHTKDEALGRAQLELQSARETLVEKDNHIRRLGVILAMKGGITVLFLLLVFLANAQPTERNLFTTNPPPSLVSVSGPFVTTNPLPAITYNGGSITNLQFGNIVGEMWSTVNPTNSTTIFGSEFATITNNMGLMILADNYSTDGSLVTVFTPETSSGSLDPARYFSNSPPQDSIIYGTYPGMNANPAGSVIQDSGVVGILIAANATNIQNSLLYGGWSVAGVANGLFSCFMMGSGTGGGLRGNGQNDFYMGIACGPPNNSPNLTNQMVIGNGSGAGRGFANMTIGNSSTIITTSGTNNTLIGFSTTIPAGITNLFLLGNQYQVVGTFNQFIGTNGLASYATNVNNSIVSTGFTNDTTHGFGTNSMMVHFIASVGETVAFYMRSGANGQTSCGTLLYTDTGITSANYPVGINCGIALSVGTFTSGQAYAYP